MNFYAMALALEDVYGTQFDEEEEFVICPECGEPIYADDWGNIDFSYCPICGFDFGI